MYYILLILVNRFWIASEFFLILSVVIATIEKFKIVSRSEPILPSDLGFVSGGNTQNLAAWLPYNAGGIIVRALIFLVIFSIPLAVFGFWDTRTSVVRDKRVLNRYSKRLVSLVIALVFLISFVTSMSTPGGWSYYVINTFGDEPVFFNSQADAQNNGTVVGFSRLLNPKVMDKPANYSEKR